VRAETPCGASRLDDKIYQKSSRLERLLHDMVMDPAHPLRTPSTPRSRLHRAAAAFAEVIERAEALKKSGSWGADDELARKCGMACGRDDEVCDRDRAARTSAPSPLDSGLANFGVALLSNPTLLAEIDDLLIDVTQGRRKVSPRIGDLIAKTVASWIRKRGVARSELAVGRTCSLLRIKQLTIQDVGCPGLSCARRLEGWRALPDCAPQRRSRVIV